MVTSVGGLLDRVAFQDKVTAGLPGPAGPCPLSRERRRRTLRILAVVSDGWYPDMVAAQKLITTLHHTGCAVLWLQPASHEGHTYTHTTTIRVADPIDAITTIGDAAVAALAAA